MTLQQVYRCAIDPELFAAKIEQAEAWSDELSKGTVFIPVRKRQMMTQNETGRLSGQHRWSGAIHGDFPRDKTGAIKHDLGTKDGVRE